MSQEHATPHAWPRPSVRLPISGPSFERPTTDLLAQLQAVSSATASAELHKMGIRHTFMRGPAARQTGVKIIGPAITLQFMPQREDIASGASQEQGEKLSALWAVLDEVQPGDVLVTQAYGDPYTGCFGEMLITYCKGRGGVGLVVDGCIRDWPKVQQIGLPVWTCGVTPNYSSQAGLFPWAYNVPIACGGVLVLPGDIIIADDDGAVLVPAGLASDVLHVTLDHEDWETFSRIKLAEGGALRTYYPLNEEGRREYEAWRLSQQKR
ncbi:MAG TPA: ribonuclease activity regulator RraA [Chloroflexota bacterium]|jgi:regulator of RNase E activity RraA|nr:ribonuclease activity regulator RraA [Chloroflexota bacterium]